MSNLTGTETPRFRAALIDMDGVLYNTMPYHTLAWQRMITEIGIPCTRDEFYAYEGMTGVATIDLLFQRQYGKNCDPDEARRLYAIKSRYFAEMGRKERMPGADRVLKILKDNGIQRVLVTGSGQASVLESIDADYPGAFDSDKRITAHDVTHGKPHPEPYLKGAELAGVNPAQCIVIENAPLGVKAGKAAGCFTVAVMTGPIPIDEMKAANPDLILNSMDELADYLPTLLNFGK